VNFNYKTKYDEAEFARQLADQEAGMNKLTVDEYLKNRERYIAEGRAIEGNMAQQAARENAYLDKVTELRRNGLSQEQAKIKAKEWMDTQAALHNPDQIAGGNPVNIGGMGNKAINSSIGSQWKYRIDAVDEQIQAMIKNMTDTERKNTYLNIKLKY
jgi:Novel toxin 15